MKSVADETAGVENFGWSLGVLLRAYGCATAEVLEGFPHGHRGQQVLAAVVHGDQPSQLALATHLGIDRTVMTYLIDDLVSAGLVERQPNPHDRRQRKIVATKAGHAALREVEQQVRTAEEHTMAALDPAERQVFRDLLRRVACGAREIGDEIDVCDAVERV